MRRPEVRNMHELELVRMGLLREQRQQEKCLQRDIEPYKRIARSTSNLLSGLAVSVKDFSLRYQSVWRWVAMAGRVLRKLIGK